MKKKMAGVISRIFDPVLEIPVVIILALWVAVGEGIRWRFLGLLMFLDMVVPLIFFLLMLYHKQISDWDIRRRSERLPIYFFTMLCHLGGVWLAHEVGKTELALILLVFWILGVLFSLVTAFWKISLHGGVNAVLIVFVNVISGWQYPYLLFILPLVGWARVYDKHHTPVQYWSGVLLGGGVCYIALKMVGF